MQTTYPWQYLEEEQLLSLRLKDLHLDLAESWIMELITQLGEELKQKGLNLRPHFWISDDWFCPDGSTGIAIPFFVLHPRLHQLEQKMMGKVDGKDRNECMKILRHECGHAIDNAYHLRRSKRRQQIFGKSSQTYPQSYFPNPYSKSFVRYLADHYAQSHPDEDFAETFAVWLDPESGWQKTYKKWPCYSKLLFMSELMNDLKHLQPKMKKKTLERIENNSKTLAQYYKEKRSRLRLNQRPVLKDEKHILFTSRITSTKAKDLIQEIKPELQIRLKRNSFEINPFLKTVNRSLHGLYVKNPTKKLKNELLEILVSKGDNFYKKGYHRIIM